MKRQITFKIFLTAIALVTGLCLGIFANAQTKPISLECDASFKATHLYAKSLPPQYGGSKFEAIQKGNDDYQWDFGDGTPGDIGAIVNHKYKKTGKYYVTLVTYTISKDSLHESCKNFKGEWVTIEGIINDPDPNPTNIRCEAKLSYSLDKNVVTIQDEFDIKTLVYDGIDVKRTWHWGDGTSEEGLASAFHTYQTAGIYTITLVKSAYKNLCFPDNLNCKELPLLLCQEKYSVTVTVTESNPIKKCPTHIIQSLEGQTVTFKDNLIVDYFDNKYIESYEWYFGDGSSGIGRNVSHTYSSVGQYPVRLKKTVWYVPCPIQPNGITCMAVPTITCKGEDYFNVMIKCISKIIYKADGLGVLFVDSVAKGPNGSLLDSGTVKFPVIGFPVNSPFTQKYIWDFGDGSTDTTATYSVGHQYKQPGSYKVKLANVKEATEYWNGNTGFTGMGGPCTSYSEIEINVAGEEKKCGSYFNWTLNGNKITVKTDSHGDKIGYSKLDFGDGDWIEGDGISIATQHTYSKSGTYEVCLRIATLPDSIFQFAYIPWYCSDKYCQTITVENRIVDGLDDHITLLHVSAYPNPANDKVTFNITNPKGPLDLKILDMSGYFVKEVKDLIKQQETISVSDLNEGVYIYSLSDANGVLKNGKLIIAR